MSLPSLHQWRNSIHFWSVLFCLEDHSLNYPTKITPKNIYRECPCISETSLISSVNRDNFVFRFMPPDDPLGRNGPSLASFLSKKSLIPEPKWRFCPYGMYSSMLCANCLPTSLRAEETWLLYQSWLGEPLHCTCQWDNSMCKIPHPLCIAETITVWEKLGLYVLSLPYIQSCIQVATASHIRSLTL